MVAWTSLLAASAVTTTMVPRKMPARWVRLSPRDAADASSRRRSLAGIAVRFFLLEGGMCMWGEGARIAVGDLDCYALYPRATHQYTVLSLSTYPMTTIIPKKATMSVVRKKMSLAFQTLSVPTPPKARQTLSLALPTPQ